MELAMENFTVFCAKRNAPIGLVASQAFLTIVRNGPGTVAFTPIYQNALDVTGDALRRLPDLARTSAGLANRRVAKPDIHAVVEFAGGA
jgi:hypothetical protein